MSHGRGSATGRWGDWLVPSGAATPPWPGHSVAMDPHPILANEKTPAPEKADAADRNVTAADDVLAGDDLPEAERIEQQNDVA